MQTKALLLAVSLLGAIHQLPMAYSLGCPKISGVKDFNVKDFAGTWYQQASLGTLLFQGFGSCAKAEYTLDEATKTVSVLNTQKGLFGNQMVKGTAVLADTTSDEGKLSVTLETLLGKQTADLYILATDYTNFAILYSCKGLVLPLKSAWILTRKQKLEGEDKISIDKKIEEAFDQINLNKDTPKRSDFTATPQDNC